MSAHKEIADRLAILDAERLVLTVELRNALLRAASELLPTALRQAKGQARRGKRDARPGSPALLRLIARLAMRDVRVDRTYGPHNERPPAQGQGGHLTKKHHTRNNFIQYDLRPA